MKSTGNITLLQKRKEIEKIKKMGTTYVPWKPVRMKLFVDYVSVSMHVLYDSAS